jgi:Pentapeptide repeats (8 copies)
VIRSLEHQRSSRLLLAKWLVIPALVLGIPAEYFWREEMVKQDYRRIENSKGGEQTSALSRFREGCHAKGEFVWVPIYFSNRFFGNCGELRNANLSNANLNGVDLSRADLRNAKTRRNFYFTQS